MNPARIALTAAINRAAAAGAPVYVEVMAPEARHAIAEGARRTACAAVQLAKRSPFRHEEYDARVIEAANILIAAGAPAA